MTESSKQEQSKSATYVPSSDEEKLEAFELLGDLLKGLKEEQEKDRKDTASDA